MTADHRYPHGPFTSVGRTLTDHERSALIDRIEAHPANMRSATTGLDDAQLDTPYRDGGWTVRQVVHHVVDSHVNSYIRFKLAVTEDQPRITTYDQTAWADLPDGKTAPIETSLLILDAIHPRWVAFLKALPAAAFGRTVDHPEFGDMTVDALLELYGWHCPHHEGHITTLRGRMGW
jgi:hypothetical protein